MPRVSSIAIATLLLALCATPCRADETFRCGKWLVSSDLSPAEVLQKCGEPHRREERTQDVLTRNQFDLMVKTGETVIETWIYDRGTQAAPMVVTIVDGKIKSIERAR